MDVFFESNWDSGNICTLYCANTLKDEALWTFLKEEHNDIETFINEELQRYRAVLDTQVEDLLKHSALDEFSRTIYARNLQLMKQYREQRHGNKMVYHYLLSKVVDFILEKGVKTIRVPFTKALHHVLNSIQNELLHQRITVTSDIISINEGGCLQLELRI
jgi:hypothetical protein